LTVAAAAGLLMAVQGTLNSGLGKAVGLLEATLLVHVISSLFTLVLLLAGLGSGQWSELGRIPWYFYLGGFLGVGITYGVVRAVPLVGVAPATTAIIVGQVATAALIDHLGLLGMEKLGFEWLNGLGLLLLAAGGYLLLR
jgi:transporter family-2 protein